MKSNTILSGAITLLVALAVQTASSDAQSPQGSPTENSQSAFLTQDQLQELVGPFALYPDDLVALILPASTTPLEIVKAQRFLTKYANDKTLKPDPSLSQPVLNLLTYPDVVDLLGNDLDWTEALGQAFLAQQQEVLEAIQIFRRKAQSAGNLKTDEKQTVIVKEEVVQIVPTQPEVIYVPQYKPATVVVVQPTPVVTYIPTAYPVYYHPGAAVAAAATIGYIAGVNNAYGCNWYGGGIYVAPHVAHYGHIQDERIDYANNAREDWQDYGKASREDWQKHANKAQDQRQQAVKDTTASNQGQRQDAISGGQDQRTANQGQRQQAASGAQAAARDSQTQRQNAAQGNQAQRQSAAQARESSRKTPAGSANWKPSAQTRPTTATAGRTQQRSVPSPSTSQFGRQSTTRTTSSFGNTSSGTRAQTHSTRGERSMSGARGGSREGRSGRRKQNLELKNMNPIHPATCLALGMVSLSSFCGAAPKAYETPVAASDAFIEAAKAGETSALLEIFGEEYADLIGTAEPERDRELRAKVATMAIERRRFRFDDETSVTMVIGADAWPFPIPIVKSGETWTFDTGKGIEEIVKRRVGENELSAIATIGEYFEAQTAYAAESRDESGVRKYASKFISSPAGKDGLHWSDGDATSPAGPEIKDELTPHNGYHFKVLTAQGEAAPGGAYNYIINGHLIGGFALIAWPAEYRKTGVMSFIINHYGEIYQADLGAETSKIAGQATEYNPSENWQLESEEPLK